MRARLEGGGARLPVAWGFMSHAWAATVSRRPAAAPMPLQVGGASEVEVGEKKDRITDALNATKVGCLLEKHSTVL